MGLKKKIYSKFNKASQDYFSMHNSILLYYTFSVRYFSVYKHKKLNYFNFFFRNKFYNFSNGQLIRNRQKIIKSFKKSLRSFGASINILYRKLKKNITRIYSFYIKNFTKTTYIWVKKFFYLLKPSIYMTIITDSWNYIVKHKRRIKKKVFKNLFKYEKTV